MVFRPIVLTVSADPELPAFERRGEPVAVGVACPRGAVLRAARWGLTDQRGRGAAVQTTVLDRWTDGSIRWLLAEFQADVDAESPGYYALAPDDTVQPGAGIVIERAGETIKVKTGAATFDVPRSGTAFLSAVAVGGRSLLDSTLVAGEDQDGARYELAIWRTTVERAGARRADLRIDGQLVDAVKRPWLDATMRLHFFAGLGTVKAEFSVANPRAARQPDSALIRELSIAIVPGKSGGADLWASIDSTDRMAPAGARFAMRQEPSGFRAVRDGREVAGLQALPIASIGGGDTRVSVAVPRFPEPFPREIAVDQHHCALSMFPRRRGDRHQLMAGERSTLTFAACFGRDTVSAAPLAWMRSPLRVSAEARSYRDARVWAPLAKANHGTLPHGLGDDSLAGDITRFLETGEPRWWTRADELARQVNDIDIPRTDIHSTGLMLHYFLTGSERSRAAVIQLANGLLARRDTDTAAMAALFNAHRLTGEPRFLEHAESLIARFAAIAPPTGAWQSSEWMGRRRA